MKKNYRAIGIDDGPFEKGKDAFSTMVGVLMRADFLIESVSMKKISVDGTDSTGRIIEMVENDFKRNAAVIMTYGVTFGGFNVADLFKVNLETAIPVISITRKRPDMSSVFSAIANTQQEADYKLGIMKSYHIQEFILENGSSIFINPIGIDAKSSSSFIKKLTRTGNIPEPIRIANIVASALRE
ncbi:MAG: endonuclease dU [Thermoplasmataceae archaeon]